jgi:hypothetical protein
MTLFRDAALNLAARGLRVFPCRIKSKEPLINDNLNRATTDRNIIEGWWTDRPFNIGIATGEESGVWVLDIDGQEGAQTLRDLEAAHGELPPTITAITGSGRHYYWKWPTDVEIRNTQARDDIPGIDARGEGGYVIAPPSIHPSGRGYLWLPDVNEFAFAPQWLLDVITRKHAAGAGAGTAQAMPPGAWSSFFGMSFNGSRRSSAMAKAAGFFLRKNIDPMVALDLVRLFNNARCEPPLDDAEIIRVVTSISRRELERWQ